jgi:hypothetical protein
MERWVKISEDLRKMARMRMMAAREGERTESLQVVLSTEELAAVDEFRFENRLPAEQQPPANSCGAGLLHRL